MIVTFKQGDIFQSECSTLVNPVNCVGVMGKGLAKQFAERYPYCVPTYMQACRDGMLWPGRVLNSHGLHKFVLHFPTKVHWRERSQLWYIESGLWAVRNHMLHDPSRSGTLAIPALGCGEGGLAWLDVRPLIEKVMSKTFCKRIEVYEPR